MDYDQLQEAYDDLFAKRRTTLLDPHATSFPGSRKEVDPHVDKLGDLSDRITYIESLQNFKWAV
jgi:hypothetical protein